MVSAKFCRDIMKRDPLRYAVDSGDAEMALKFLENPEELGSMEVATQNGKIMGNVADKGMDDVGIRILDVYPDIPLNIYCSHGVILINALCYKTPKLALEVVRRHYDRCGLDRNNDWGGSYPLESACRRGLKEVAMEMLKHPEHLAIGEYSGNFNDLTQACKQNMPEVAMKILSFRDRIEEKILHPEPGYRCCGTAVSFACENKMEEVQDELVKFKDSIFSLGRNDAERRFIQKYLDLHCSGSDDKTEEPEESDKKTLLVSGNEVVYHSIDTMEETDDHKSSAMGDETEEKMVDPMEDDDGVNTDEILEEMLWGMIHRAENDCTPPLKAHDKAMMEEHGIELQRVYRRLELNIIKKVGDYLIKNNPFERYEDDPRGKSPGYYWREMIPPGWRGFFLSPCDMIDLFNFIIGSGREVYYKFLNHPETIEEYYLEGMVCQGECGMMIEIPGGNDSPDPGYNLPRLSNGEFIDEYAEDKDDASGLARSKLLYRLEFYEEFADKK